MDEVTTRRMVYVLTFLAIITVGGYLAINIKSDTNPGSNSPVRVEATSYPLKLVLSLNKTNYALGENVTINLKLINVGNKTINVVFSNPPELDFTIYNSAGQKIYSYSQAHVWPMMMVGKTLASNASLCRTIIWTLKRLDRYDPTQQVALQVEPEIYFISAQTGNLLEFKIIETPKIRIEIEG